jgi:prepilin-type N-terminal cleavage/methylation domain-containing protein
MATNQHPKGFVLIELIAVIVLVGVIAAFTTFFLYSGIKGYLSTKKTNEGALNAQMALDRISLELRDLDYFTSFTEHSSLTFTSVVVSGTRRLSYSSEAIWLSIDTDNNKLLGNVDSGSFILSKTARDLNDDGSDEVAFFEVGFSLNEMGRDFKTKIFPRHMVDDK